MNKDTPEEGMSIRELVDAAKERRSQLPERSRPTAPRVAREISENMVKKLPAEEQ